MLEDNGVNLQSVYGGTEFGAPTSIISDARRPRGVGEWEYIEFDEQKAKINWEERGANLYEPQFLVMSRLCSS